MASDSDASGDFEIDHLAPSFGAEVRALDVTKPMSAETVSALQSAWANYGVLLFRGQEITDEVQVRFAQRFGPLLRYSSSAQSASRPQEIFRAANTDDNNRILPIGHHQVQLLKLNWLWHTDSSYLETPVAGVVLRGVEVAGRGGHTAFANLRLAYEALPRSERNRIDTLRVLHSFEFLVRHHDVPGPSKEEVGCMPSAVHPLVRRNSNGRRSLFLSPAYMETVIDWNEDEARELLDYLTAWASQERFLYVHRWRQGDLILWDNRWTMHKVMPYPIGKEKRVVHGVTIQAFSRPIQD